MAILTHLPSLAAVPDAMMAYPLRHFKPHAWPGQGGLSLPFRLCQEHGRHATWWLTESSGTHLASSTHTHTVHIAPNVGN